MKAGLFTLSITNVVNGDRLRKSKFCENVGSQQKLVATINEMYSIIENYIRLTPHTFYGYIDTTNEIELTRNNVIQAIIEIENDRKIRARGKELESIERHRQEKIEYEKKKKRAYIIECSKMLDRHHLHGCSKSFPKSYRDSRLAINKYLVLKRKYNVTLIS